MKKKTKRGATRGAKCRCGCGRRALIGTAFYEEACRVRYAGRRPQKVDRKREAARKRYNRPAKEHRHPYVPNDDFYRNPGVYAYYRREDLMVLKVGSSENVSSRTVLQASQYDKAEVGVVVLCWYDGPSDRLRLIEAFYQRRHGVRSRFDPYVHDAMARLGIDPVRFWDGRPGIPLDRKLVSDK